MKRYLRVDSDVEIQSKRPSLEQPHLSESLSLKEDQNSIYRIARHTARGLL